MKFGMREGGEWDTSTRQFPYQRTCIACSPLHADGREP
jgi:hypothetical protein